MGGLLILSAVITTLICMIIYKKKTDEYDIYKIKKGWHFSFKNTSLIPFKFGIAPKTYRCEAIFGSGCDYDSNIVEDDISKLVGILYGFREQYNSIRVGWRFNTNLQVFELFAFKHVKGKREYKFLAHVKQYDSFFISIFKESQNTIVEIKCGEVTYTATIKDLPNSWIKFKLFPYFGGTITAPQNMNIFIREIK